MAKKKNTLDEFEDFLKIKEKPKRQSYQNWFEKEILGWGRKGREK